MLARAPCISLQCCLFGFMDNRWTIAVEDRRASYGSQGFRDTYNSETNGRSNKSAMSDSIPCEENLM